MEPMGLTQGALAEAMGVQRKHVNELCGNRRNVTAATALFWPACSATAPTSGPTCSGATIFRVMNTPKERERIERARPLQNAT